MELNLLNELNIIVVFIFFVKIGKQDLWQLYKNQNFVGGGGRVYFLA